MFKVLLALVRIAKEVRRIREVLEIAYSQELLLHERSKSYSKSIEGEVELDAVFIPKRNIYGEIENSEEEEEEEYTETNVTKELP